MFLVQILLPLYDNDGGPLPRRLFLSVGRELTERFGGLTAYTSAPAKGLWKSDADRTHRDEIVLYEVMTETLDTDWWRDYRRGLEQRFQQEQVIVRAQETRLL